MYIDYSQIEGLGTAGTPVGGIVTVQGTTGGKPVISRIQDKLGADLVLSNGQIPVADIISNSGQYRAQSVTTIAALALGGSSALANRKLITVQPTNGGVYWGFDALVTITTGTPIFKNQMMTFSFSTPIYLIAAATVDVRITEGS